MADCNPEQVKAIVDQALRVVDVLKIPGIVMTVLIPVVVIGRWVLPPNIAAWKGKGQ